MLTPEESEEFVEMLESENFVLEDWEFLETLLKAEGLTDDQMKDLEKLRETIKVISEKYAIL